MTLKYRTVEENLLMGGYLMEDVARAREAVERILDKYARLAERRHKPAKVLSGGERRLLEISRAGHESGGAAGRRALDRP